MKRLLQLFISVILTSNAYAQFLLTPLENDEDIIELIKKEDFSSLSKILNSEDFTATKQDYNYDHGTYRVIADLELTKNLGAIVRAAPLSDIPYTADEHLNINYSDYGTYKHLIYTHWYTTCCVLNFRGILSYFAQLPLTYIVEPNKTLVSNSYRFQGYEFPTWKDSIIADDFKGIDKYKLKNFWNEDQVIDSDNHFIFINKNDEIGPLASYDINYWKIKNNIIVGDFYYMTIRADVDYPVDNNIINVPLIKSENLYYLYIQIGDANKKYIFDSGASYISLSEDDYKQFVDNNIVNTKPTFKQFALADGSIIVKKCVLIPEWKMGKIILRNVNAVIVKNGEPLLFGESVLNQFKSWKIDNNTNKLIIEVK